ncbi:hypothetical protein ANN_11971 [Periplaneta americana]|uniref:Uncharacterized protein n=1 Tax=Periplaneta americana TaxID=6978 RepID=A0ABQ8T6J7_PERAM|nr:hypothetical protein ANN_11971 [Periplaneta americana]
MAGLKAICDTESYPAFAHIGSRKNPGKNLNQVTCPDRESNPGHLVSRPDVLTVTPQSAEDHDDGVKSGGETAHEPLLRIDHFAASPRCSSVQCSMFNKLQESG